jgi:translation initiation factor IF-2
MYLCGQMQPKRLYRALTNIFLMQKRLAKVATELNVGWHTLVETLKSKGFDIDDKPTSLVTEEMYSVLQKEYAGSLAIKEQVDHMREQSSRRREETRLEPVTPPPPAVTKPVEEPEVRVEPEVKEIISEPLAKKDEVVVPAPIVAEQPSVQETPKVILKGPKIVGRINLDKSQPAPKVDNKREPVAPPKEKLTEEPLKKVEPPVVEQPVVEQPKIEVQPPVVEATPAKVVEQPPMVVHSEEVVENKVAEIFPSEDIPDNPFYRGETPQLKGLKILGKVNLTANTPKKKEEPKKDDKKLPVGGDKGKVPTPAVPNANAEDADKKKRKRKRKKIVRPETGTSDAPARPNNPQQQGGNNNNPQQQRPHFNDNRGGNNYNNNPYRGKGTPPPQQQPFRQDGVKEVSQKEIDDKIRATMARLSGGKKTASSKRRRDDRDKRRERLEKEELQNQESANTLQLTEFVTVSELASLMGISVPEIITTCMSLGVFVSINQRLDAEVIELLCSEYDYSVEFISAEESLDIEDDVEDAPESLLPRAPIVTVMGHVDHGKTSLLDHIRKANVVAGEAGGITQHIGAYEVKVDNRKITFLDTPGHEAFTAMRARGAKVTDIAVVIVAADDSVMPQTKEALSHAQAAGVPIIFAINKIDKPGASPERIKQELAGLGFLVEEWGGKYQSQDISAKFGLNIELLMEKILLEADILDLKANPDRTAQGVVLEATLDKGRGYVTKILVQNGTLHIGDPMIAGMNYGKIKAMYNETGKSVKQAGPSTPVLALGLKGAPQAGDKFKIAESEQEARQIATKRAQIKSEQELRSTKRLSLEEIGRRLALGSFKELNLIIKGDFDGSVEALSDSLLKLSTETVQVRIIHKAVGQIIESDVLLASASDAIIMGFQVRPSSGARKLAEQEGVQIKGYSVIYEAIEETKAAIEGMLEPTKEERFAATIEVREVFNISKVGTVAGCYVQEGKAMRNNLLRVVRNGIVVFPTKEGAVGEFSSLKRFKDDMKEVKAGFECGLTIKNFNDIRVGDNIEVYEIIEVKQKL